MDIYLEIETPRELVKRLFLSFVKKVITAPLDSSTTAVIAAAAGPNQITISRHIVAHVPTTQSVPDGKLLKVSEKAKSERRKERKRERGLI